MEKTSHRGIAYSSYRILELNDSIGSALHFVFLVFKKNIYEFPKVQVQINVVACSTTIADVTSNSDVIIGQVHNNTATQGGRAKGISM